MLKRTVIVASVVAAMFLSGCGILGGVSQEEMDSVIADRDYYAEAYTDELDAKTELESEIADLESQVQTLEDEKTALEEELALYESGSSSSSSSSSSNGSEYTLEDFYNQPMVKEAIDAEFENLRPQYEDSYSDMGWYVIGNTFTYWYEYKEPIIDIESAAAQIESNLSDDVIRPVAEEMEETTGIDGICIEYIYYNPDGTTVCVVNYPE